MFQLLSRDAAEALREFLSVVLPEISECWWKACVIPALSFQQLRMVEERNITELQGLDLAAVLRVLEKNWYEIGIRRSLPQEARTWTKEMQHIRNKWAHAVGQPDTDDLYRDLDTLQRFLSAIKADGNLIELIRQKKVASINFGAAGSEPKPLPPDAAHLPTPPTLDSTTEFIPGDTVMLKADPSLIGAVVQVLPGQPENRYMVFIGTKAVQYYGSQLVRFESQSATEILPLESFHAHLSALQLLHPGIANLYSLRAARVDYIPYQFKPVLKFVRSDRPRILIADEVGVGKTIEAGLILRELQSRREVSSVLIICPRPLVTEHKWRNEMKRFDEEFQHLDGPTLRFCIDETDKDGCWPARYSKVILPFSLFTEELLTGSADSKKRKRKGLLDLDPLPQFDLVIVDEAHHLRNPLTWLHRGVQFFCSNAEAVAFLSATPIQLGARDLFVLLNLLRPDLILDETVFQHMSAPNPAISRAVELARRAPPGWQMEARHELEKAADTEWGRAVLQYNPDFQRLFDLVNNDELEPNERVCFIREAERLHSFSTIINRTRRRDIGIFTTRKPTTVEVPFTPEQQSLHDDILAVQAEILQQIHGDKNLLFMMTTIRRQAASCLFGLAPLLKDILTRKLDSLELDEMDPDFEEAPLHFASLEDRILEILERAERLDSRDPKLDALAKVIREKQALPNNKILLFSSFRHTLRYLLAQLQSLDLRIGYIHGDTEDDDRRTLRNRFSLPRDRQDALDLLLSSEVGCEGLDYQFCDCLVNYDLPWNPMRVEQRIGRIDRYGQKSETVTIYNFITPDTVDADIYHRCLWRIGVFRAALGGSEEIIGELTSQLREVAENYSLSPNERRARLQQLADNEIRIVLEQSELEEKQSEFFGLRLPQQQEDDEVTQAASYWLTPKALQRLVRRYLEELCRGGQDHMLGEKSLKTLRIGQEGREALLADFKSLPKKASPLHRDWEKWLKGSSQHLQITFESECAAEHPEACFITPIHPLAVQAARAVTPQAPIHTAFSVVTRELSPGSYPFAIYQWNRKGLREDVTFQPVCVDATVSARFLQLLKEGTQIPQDDVVFPDKAEFDALDNRHQALWSAARLDHVSYNSELVRFRRESLLTSHAARVALLKDQLNNATNDKIRLMRKSQVECAETDCARRLEELTRAESQADIAAHPIAFGVMQVVD
ncbi:helicase-related protein [Geomonas subterranea]|uniref:helicase-related protein n=1 Tax=Geomonas subterranea TaxID=2847989 RepID=UPI001CD43B68|nr:helicase-related protein [Geomonas fuzhouensis]